LICGWFLGLPGYLLREYPGIPYPLIIECPRVPYYPHTPPDRWGTPDAAVTDYFLDKPNF